METQAAVTERLAAVAGTRTNTTLVPGTGPLEGQPMLSPRVERCGIWKA
jgi:hypothetical protein